ncbi:MAG TPA: branched-chain amino acid ABC transporter permease [Ramlibacter sp.]|nr:branched-chain amino acid ABC transporter permease [Ramlibacter sp.]
MDGQMILTQLLNGLQFGILLFLLSAGLTLVFGIMNFVNLAHGAFYMVGAYVGATASVASGSFLVGVGMALLACMLLGLVLEAGLLSKLYPRDHLDQVLATFGLILVFNEVARWLWGPAPVYINAPEALNGVISIGEWSYPAYRLAITGAGAGAGLVLYLLLARTRVGMLIRAGSVDAEMVAAMGANIKLLNTLVFAVGTALAGLAGVMAGPIVSVQPGMGEPVLILALVVIVTGGIGSLRGAFYGALIVGTVDTLGRAFLPQSLDTFFGPSFAQAAGPAIASMLIYLLMAGVLAFRPAGLFPPMRAR